MYETKWDDKPLPNDWTDNEKSAALSARQFFAMLSSRDHYGSLKATAIALGYKRADSLDQVCDGRQVPGLAILSKIWELGYSPAEVYPQHKFSIAVQQGESKSVPLLELDPLKISLWLNGESESTEHINGFISGHASLPARFFGSRLNSNAFVSRGLSLGRILLFSPDIPANTGKIVLVKASDDRAIIREMDDSVSKESVLAVAFSATQERLD